MVSRAGMPPVSADMMKLFREWVDEICQVGAGKLEESTDDRDQLLAQISVATFFSLYAREKVARLALLAIEAGASNTQLAWAAGVTPQTAHKRFPQPKRRAAA